MKSKIIYNRFFAYSENKNKSFFTKFSPEVNIIHGKNTSGKSTLIQAIQYTFGINDEKHKLAEVLEEKVIFRLDFILKKDEAERISILRDNDFIYIKREDFPTKKFRGISGNNSQEHKILKEYLSELFGFNLNLESSGEYKLASLEAMFLPYYVAQDYGWVLTLKSFRGLDFFRNFKGDYYDYYLGITNEYDRLRKQILENEKKTYEVEIKFLVEREQNDNNLHLSKLKDEQFIFKSGEYIERYKINKDLLIKYEKEYLLACNKLTFLEDRLTILRKIKEALKKQNPLENDCPTCRQKLPNSIENIYEYLQNVNDTNKQINEIVKINEDLKKLKGNINSLEADIRFQKEQVSKDYSILLQYKIDDLAFSSWLDNKANVQLSKNNLTQIGETQVKLKGTIDNLQEFKTEEELWRERNAKDNVFAEYFEEYLNELGVKEFEDKNYLRLYRMSLFPKQGVELLKTLLAYYFAFNKIIRETSYVHRLPFMIDAIFKEDIDESNKELILKFLNKNKPIDTQIIMSIAESKDNKITASYYNEKFLNNKAKLILINKEEERAFLSDFNNENEEFLKETLRLME